MDRSIKSDLVLAEGLEEAFLGVGIRLVDFKKVFDDNEVRHGVDLVQDQGSARFVQKTHRIGKNTVSNIGPLQGDVVMRLS